MRLTDVQVNNTIDFTDMNVNIETNQELGNFQYGGSTLVLIHPSIHKLTTNGIIIEYNSSKLKCDSMIKKFFKKLFSYIYTFVSEFTLSPKELATLQSEECTISPVETEIKVGYDIYE